MLTSTRIPPITNHDKNKLYYGDNLEVLRDYIPDQSVDLIYLDPPFNSRQDYNVLFAEKDGTRSASQITAFKDTWEWNEEADRNYEEVIEQGGPGAGWPILCSLTAKGGLFAPRANRLPQRQPLPPRAPSSARILRNRGPRHLSRG